MKKRYTVYILRCSDNSYYTGMTSDIIERMKSHNEGDINCAKHTKFRRPVELVFSVQGIREAKNARLAEKYIKSLTRDRKEMLINRNTKMIALLNLRIDKNIP